MAAPSSSPARSASAPAPPSISRPIACCNSRAISIRCWPAAPLRLRLGLEFAAAPVIGLGDEPGLQRTQQQDAEREGERQPQQGMQPKGRLVFDLDDERQADD